MFVVPALWLVRAGDGFHLTQCSEPLKNGSFREIPGVDDKVHLSQGG